MEHWCNNPDSGAQRKTCPGAILSTTHLTWTGEGSKPGLYGERPASKVLSLDTAYVKPEFHLIIT
jgi:hypothetical protein